MTVGRFAPSPTGPLHLGNLRTALLAWCFSRHADGRFLVRVEDLTTGAAPLRESEQLADLDTLGLDHDGPIVRQSERRALYDEAIDRLVAAGLTYPCYCSRREIRDAAGAPHGPDLDGGYPGTCAELSQAQRRARAETGRVPALRVRGGGQALGFDDRLLGHLDGAVDDFVLRRADGVAAYNLAVVVDDAAQSVDEVVRGDDLVHTTPRQVFLQRLLGLPTPRYCHVPLVMGDDGERLAKRHGVVGLSDRLDLGESPERVLGRLAESFGCADSGESLTARQVLERFDPDDLDIGPTVEM